jgi:MGT family glycosyltransferase
MESELRFLMMTWDGGGNVPPELGVARRLIARDHQVHVLAPSTIAGAAEASGCTFSPWHRRPRRTTLDPSQGPHRDRKAKNPLALLKARLCPIEFGPAADNAAADTAELIASVQPDVVVCDSSVFGSIIAAQAAALPVVLLVPNIWILPTAGTTPVGPGFAPAKTSLGRTRDAAMRALANHLFGADLPAVNAVRGTYGLAPLSSIYDQALGADRILVLTSPVFDYASISVPANVRYVGPILDDPEWAGTWTPPWPEGDRRPLVLVNFSSTYQNQGPLLRRVVEALSTLPVRAVVTRGQMLDGEQLSSSTNVCVIESAPHRQILAEASLVVSHCGHGTTMKTLAAGVPMVCIPMGRDQNDTAARVVFHRAGVRLPPVASSKQIRKAVQRVLDEPSFRASAARVGSAILDARLTTDVVAELEALSGT